MNRFHFLIFVIGASLIAAPASYAQEDSRAVMDRLDRLQRDISLLQRQVARGDSGSIDSGDIGVGSAQLVVRLTAMEEEMRKIRGTMEENQFQIRKLNENMDKLQRDNEFRFGELEKAQRSTAATTTSSNTTITPEPAAAEKKAISTASEAVSERKPINTPAASVSKSTLTSAGDGVLRMPNRAELDKHATPRDLYNHAFRMLNETRYDEAAEAFALFAEKFPNDPLIGNAYYWEGETYYIRRDFVNAADMFRQGFESLPDGPKAADNLLKLAMSLDALQRTKEACVVLGQVTTRFKKTSVTVTEKAMQEQKRLGCK